LRKLPVCLHGGVGGGKLGRQRNRGREIKECLASKRRDFHSEVLWILNLSVAEAAVLERLAV